MKKEFKKMLAKDIFKDLKQVSTPATVTESAFEYMKHYQESGLELGYHDLTLDQFVGWCAAYGLNKMIAEGLVVGSYKMKPKDNLKELVKSKMKNKE